MIASRKLFTLGFALTGATLLLSTLLPGFLPDSVPGMAALKLSVGAEARSRKKTKTTTKSYKSTSHTSRTSRISHKRSHHARKAVVAAKPRYAYPLDFFMLRAPEFDTTPLDISSAKQLNNAFACGVADDFSAPQLVRASVFHHHPLSGGIFRRREAIKYIVLHSTETGVPVPAKNVINSWSSMGRRHPGAQFVVERNGTIYLAVDPDLGTVHVNIFKTLPGINNDNSIGIEMNHTGRQDYPSEQRSATVRLVTYLQHRYNIASENVITHKYAQQGDHTDPVHFDLEGFLSSKEDFRSKALAMKRQLTPSFTNEATEADMPLASIYVQIHGQFKAAEAMQGKTPGYIAPKPPVDFGIVSGAKASSVPRRPSLATSTAGFPAASQPWSGVELRGVLPELPEARRNLNLNASLEPDVD